METNAHTSSVSTLYFSPAALHLNFACYSSPVTVNDLPRHTPQLKCVWVSSSIARLLCEVCTSCCLNAPYFVRRGKCNVTLLNETDVLASYLDKEVKLFVIPI